MFVSSLSALLYCVAGESGATADRSLGQLMFEVLEPFRNGLQAFGVAIGIAAGLSSSATIVRRSRKATKPSFPNLLPSLQKVLE